MKTLRPIIDEHPLLQTMNLRHREILAECAVEGEFKPDQIIFKQGDYADKFFLVQSGKVALEAHTPDRGNILVQTLGAGEALGWSWLFPPFVWHFQARAVEPTEAIAFCGAHLLVACEKDTDLGYDLMKRVSQVLIQRLQATRKKLVDLCEGRSGPSAK